MADPAYKNHKQDRVLFSSVAVVATQITTRAMALGARHSPILRRRVAGFVSAVDSYARGMGRIGLRPYAQSVPMVGE